MGELKPCPCGTIPSKLLIQPNHSEKWMSVEGDCCGIWTIEFRANYSDGEELQRRAREAWNEAPRSSVNNTKEQKTMDNARANLSLKFDNINDLKSWRLTTPQFNRLLKVMYSHLHARRFADRENEYYFIGTPDDYADAISRCKYCA